MTRKIEHTDTSGVLQRLSKAVEALRLRGRTDEKPEKQVGLVRDDRGTTAVEFAMIGVPFFMMLIGLIEVTMMYGSAVVLDNAVKEAARTVRTGNAQNSGTPQATFDTALCDAASILVPCDEIVYESIVVPSGSFLDADTFGANIDNDGNLVSSGFNAGGPNDVLVVRAGYRYNFVTPVLGALFGDGMSSNSNLLLTTLTIRNEPYAF